MIHLPDNPDHWASLLLLCLAVAVLVGLPLFFLLRDAAEATRPEMLDAQLDRDEVVGLTDQLLFAGQAAQVDEEFRAMVRDEVLVEHARRWGAEQQEGAA